jgi:hypothetical protein
MASESKIERGVVADMKDEWESIKLVAGIWTGNKNGWPDRQFIHKTTCRLIVFIEFKAWGKESNDQQKKRQSELRSYGYPVLETDSYEEAIVFLKKHARLAIKSAVADL